jgi:hypothetical protein
VVEVLKVQANRGASKRRTISVVVVGGEGWCVVVFVVFAGKRPHNAMDFLCGLYRVVDALPLSLPMKEELESAEQVQVTLDMPARVSCDTF